MILLFNKGYLRFFSKAKLLKFTTASDHSLTLTENHLIYEKTKGYLKAKYVKLGDELQVLMNGTFSFSQVISMIHQFENGFIAPLTESGNLVVNGIHASCYTGVNSHSLAHLFFQPLVYWYHIKRKLNFSELESKLTKKISYYHPYLAFLKFFGIKQLAEIYF